MWELDCEEGWAPKNWCFWTVEKTLESPLDRKSNQSILKEIHPEYSLEGLMLKLKLQYFGSLMWRMGSLEKTLMQGKVECKRRRRQQRMRWLDGITDSWTWIWANSGRRWRTGKPAVLHLMVLQSWTWLSDWALEKEMAAHSSVLDWRIPGMGKPVGYHLWGHIESDMTKAT